MMTCIKFKDKHIINFGTCPYPTVYAEQEKQKESKEVAGVYLPMFSCFLAENGEERLPVTNS